MSNLNLSPEKFSLLLDIVKNINSNLDLDNILKVIIDNVKSYLNTEASSLLLIDKITNELYFNRATGNNKAFDQIRFPIGTGIAGIVAQSGKAEIVNDPEDSRIYRTVDKMSGMKTRNLIAVPLEVNQNRIGVLEVINAKDREEFSREDLDLLLFFAEFAALAINNRNLLDAAQLKVRQLDAVYRLSQMVSKQQSIKTFINTTLDIIQKNIKAGRISIIKKEKDEKKFHFLEGRGIKKPVLKKGEITLENNVLAYILLNKEGVFCSNIDNDNRFADNKHLRYQTKAFISVPFYSSANNITGFLSVSEIENESIHSENLDFLQTIAQEFYNGYNNLLMRKAALEKEKFDAELRVTAQIQESILPDKLPYFKDAAIASYSLPCKTVGGDFYDVINRNQDELLCLIADISGKGFPSTVFMSACRSIIRMTAGKKSSPKEILNEANTGIYQSSKAGMFATAFMVRINKSSKKIIYSNAGHFAQLFYKKNSGSVQQLAAKSKPLGVLEKTAYKENTLTYAAGDILVLFTDGIIEAVNRAHKIYGMERLQQTVTANSSKNVFEIKDAIIKDVKKYQTGSKFADDVSLIVIKFK
ncbi:MAG TPA: SpoIIE family protein phosphatase [Spirochaetota bacterium]|nr:SpoIIE family protein phosphatase [Spirochaetota bacterium]